MTGTTYSRDAILADVERVADARAWPSADRTRVLLELQALDGWSEWIDLDGEPDREWFAAAAALLAGETLAGASELAQLYGQLVGIETAETRRAVMNAAPVLLAQAIGENIVDTALLAQSVGDTIIGVGEATAAAVTETKRRPLLLIVGAGLLAGLLGALALRRL